MALHVVCTAVIALVAGFASWVLSPSWDTSLAAEFAVGATNTSVKHINLDPLAGGVEVVCVLAIQCSIGLVDSIEAPSWIVLGSYDMD